MKQQEEGGETSSNTSSLPLKCHNTKWKRSTPITLALQFPLTSFQNSHRFVTEHDCLLGSYAVYLVETLRVTFHSPWWRQFAPQWRRLIPIRYKEQHLHTRLRKNLKSHHVSRCTPVITWENTHKIPIIPVFRVSRLTRNPPRQHAVAAAGNELSHNAENPS
jgi:hypothetical protein